MKTLPLASFNGFEPFWTTMNQIKARWMDSTVISHLKSLKQNKRDLTYDRPHKPKKNWKLPNFLSLSFLSLNLALSISL